jgi:hypothetical protein
MEQDINDYVITGQTKILVGKAHGTLLWVDRSIDCPPNWSRLQDLRQWMAK